MLDLPPFRQGGVHRHTGQLADILDPVKFERIVDNHGQTLVGLRDGDGTIFVGQGAGDPPDRLDIDRAGLQGQDLQVHLLGHGTENLAFGDETHFDEHVAHPFARPAVEFPAPRSAARR